MRRYEIVSGTLLILSVIDFALAAPVLVQEKREACVDVVHIPRDVISVMGKRGKAGDLLDEAWDKYVKPLRNEVGSPSSSAPPTNVAEAPAPHPAWLAGPSVTSSPSSSADSVYSDEAEWWFEGDGAFHGPPYTPTSPGHDLPVDHELAGAHAPQLNPNPNPNPGPSTDHQMSSEDIPPPRLELPKEFGQAHEHQVQQPNSGPPADLSFEQNYHPASVMHPPSTSEGPPLPSPESTDPGPSSSTGSQSDDSEIQAAIYAAKGKAKVSRRIYGTAEDVGNAAQRELQPDERSLDPGE